MCVMATKTILMSDCAVIFKKRFDFWVIKKYNFLILTSQSVIIGLIRSRMEGETL